MMSTWQGSVLDRMADGLRVAITICLTLDLIMLSAWSTWFLAKFLYFSLGYINRSLFGSPW